MKENIDMPNKVYPVYSLLGTRLHALNLQDLLQIINRAVEKREKLVIGNHNLHSIYLYHHDAKMRQFYAQAQYIHIDGMSLVLFGRFLGLPLRRKHRVTYLELLGPLLDEMVRQNWRLFYLGATPTVAVRAAEILRRRFPGLQIETAHGYFDIDSCQENAAVRSRIRTYKPHLLIVGMGMPRQEHWVLDELEQIEANAILLGGSIMGYIAGVVPTPPRWMGRVGLEWLYRLVTEPRRLWKRYLLEPWFVLGLVVRAWIDRRNSEPLE